MALTTLLVSTNDATVSAVPDGMPSLTVSLEAPAVLAALDTYLCAGPGGCDGVFLPEAGECICGSGVLTALTMSYEDDSCSIPGNRWGTGSGSGSGGPPTRRRMMGFQNETGSGSGSGSGDWWGGDSGMGGYDPAPFMLPTDACLPADIHNSVKLECAGFNTIRRTFYEDTECQTPGRVEEFRNGECSSNDLEPTEIEHWQRPTASWTGGVAEMTMYQDSTKPGNNQAFCVEITGLPTGTVTINQLDFEQNSNLDCESGWPWQPEGIEPYWSDITTGSFKFCSEGNPNEGRVKCFLWFNDVAADWTYHEVYGVYEWEIRQEHTLMEWDGAEFCGGVGQPCDGFPFCPPGEPGVWNSDGKCACGRVIETFTERFLTPDTCGQDSGMPEKEYQVLDECVLRNDLAASQLASASTKTSCVNGELMIEYYENGDCMDSASATCTFANNGCDSSCTEELHGFDSMRLFWVADGICGDGIPTPEPTPYPTYAPTQCMNHEATSFDGHCHVAGDPHIYGFNGAYGTVLRDGDYKLYEDDVVSISFRSAIHGGNYNAAGVNAAYIQLKEFNDMQIEIYTRTLHQNLFPTYEVYLNGQQTTMADMCDAVSQYACSCSFVDEAGGKAGNMHESGEHLSRFSLHVDQDTLITWWGGRMDFGWASLYVEKIQGSPFGATGICTATDGSITANTDPFVNPYPEYHHDCNTSPIRKFRTDYCGTGNRRRRVSMEEMLDQCQTNEPTRFDEVTTICAPCIAQTGGVDSCVFDGCAESLDAARAMAASCHQVDVAMTPPADRGLLCAEPTPVYSEELSACVAAWESAATTTSTRDNPINTPEPTPSPTSEPTPAPVASPTSEPTPAPVAPPTVDEAAEEVLQKVEELVQKVEELKAANSAQDSELLKMVEELQAANSEQAAAYGSKNPANGVEKLGAYTSLLTLLGLSIGAVAMLLHKLFWAVPAEASADLPTAAPQSPVERNPSTAM